MTDKWIGPRVLCGDSNPPPDGYEYVRRYADDVRLAAGSGTTVENENVAGYVAFRRDWMRRHPSAAKPLPATTARPGRGRSPSRQGKRGILIHVEPELARRLKHLAVERETSLQALGVEAFQRLLAGK